MASGVASSMKGIGSAFGIVSFDIYRISAAGKMIAFFDMYIGRREMMPIFLLFVPELWRK